MKFHAYLLIPIMFSACANAEINSDAPKLAETVVISATQAISNAKTWQQKADSIGHEWRDTGKILAAAEAAAKQGDEAEAVKLAQQAELQGKAAYAQGVAQENANVTDFIQ